MLCLCSDRSESIVPFMVLIFLIFEALFFNIVFGFNFIYYFPVTIHRLDLFSGTYLKNLSVSVVPSD